VIRLRLDRPLDPAERGGLGDRLGSGVAVVDDGGRARYRLDGVPASPAVVAAVAAWCAERPVLVLELRTAAATLEERYLELVGSGGDEPGETS
jgi:hypothetical protein